MASSQLRNEGVVTAAAPVLNNNQDFLFTHSPCGKSTIQDCFLLVCVRFKVCFKEVEQIETIRLASNVEKILMPAV